ncbi:hypothetical protein [Limnobacter sp. P1]|uniref:hypothetical protein n=1 Tax=Limnobacter olei TaxID=3031298 RepID=UPI0023B06037|nr:hypothetical protein [Limnobacter sp. P1]
MSQSTPPTAAGTTAWQEPAPYEPDEEKIDEMWEAAGDGDWMRVTILMGDLELGWVGSEMKRIAQLGEHYGRLEKGADSLMSVLNAHTKDGTVKVSQGMKDFLDVAIAEMTAAGKPPSDKVMEIINKLKNGESLSQAEAQELYAWVADAKLEVVPPEYSSEVLAAQAKSARERYDQYVASSKSRIGIWSSS